jgi:hypothetical protein
MGWCTDSCACVATESDRKEQSRSRKSTNISFDSGGTVGNQTDRFRPGSSDPDRSISFPNIRRSSIVFADRRQVGHKPGPWQMKSKLTVVDRDVKRNVESGRAVYASNSISRHPMFHCHSLGRSLILWRHSIDALELIHNVRQCLAPV